MDLTALKEKLRPISPFELLKKIKEALLALWSKALSLPGRLIARLRGDPLESSEEEPENQPFSPDKRKKLAIIVFAGAAVILILSIIISTAINTERLEFDDITGITIGVTIPSEELFFPLEPDFLPGFLPEREARRFWSVEEIRPYWRTPENPDWWREEIESTVDRLMEGIP